MSVVISGPDTGTTGHPVTFVQATPAAVWGPIVHNFGYRAAAVALFSADYSQQFDEFTVQHLDDNSLRLSMDTPTAGIALIAQ